MWEECKSQKSWVSDGIATCKLSFDSKRSQKYEGQWKSGRPHGQGIFTFESGEKLTGEWEKGHFKKSLFTHCANGDAAKKDIYGWLSCFKDTDLKMLLNMKGLNHTHCDSCITAKSWTACSRDVKLACASRSWSKSELNKFFRERGFPIPQSIYTSADTILQRFKDAANTNISCYLPALGSNAESSHSSDIINVDKYYVWLIGESGSGKTTLTGILLDGKVTIIFE